ncbi:MAG: terminase small subunit [Deltaproteobacteria bacterium]|nr:terminase small subunit [Deltaproteobacteria bacterium]
MIGLKGKQPLFVKEYVIDSNAKQAAIRAGYSAKTAEVQGYQLLQKTSVQEAIAKEREKQFKRLEVKADKTLLKLMRGQEFDIRRLYHDDGTIKKPHELDDDTAAAIVGVKYKDGVFEEYKIIDVKGCSELIGRHLKLFTDKIEVSGTLNLAERIKAARDRANGK